MTPYADGDYYGFADRDGVSLHLSVEAGHDLEGAHVDVDGNSIRFGSPMPGQPARADDRETQ